MYIQSCPARVFNEHHNISVYYLTLLPSKYCFTTPTVSLRVPRGSHERELRVREREKERRERSLFFMLSILVGTQSDFRNASLLPPAPPPPIYHLVGRAQRGRPRERKYCDGVRFPSLHTRIRVGVNDRMMSREARA